MNLSSSHSDKLIANRYQLVEKIGAGGMGEVFHAHDRLNNTSVALKRVIIPADLLDANDYQDDRAELHVALAREFRMLASLRHPHIITVLDYGFDANGHPFFTMPLLDNGIPLLTYSQPQSTIEKIQLTLQLLQALAYLHRRGILHRDLKPSNIMVCDASLMVFDFGVAIETSRQSTLKKGIAGTLTYIAPEIFLGQPPSPSSDLYAVGIILYQMLVGTHPFPTSNKSSMMQAIISEKPDLSALAALDMPTITFNPDSVVHPSTPANQSADTEPKTDYADEPPTQFAIADDDFATQAEHLPLDPAMAELAENLEATPERVQQPLTTIIGKLLEKTPVTRYTDAYEVMLDLCNAATLTLPIETRAIRESFLQAGSFIGRKAELKQLTDALSSMLFSKKGKAWVITGEGGVGKSRLIDELRIQAMVKGPLVAKGQCVDGGGLPYQIWRDVLPTLLLATEVTDLEAGILKPIVPHIEQILGRTIPDAPEIEGKTSQDRLVFTIADVLKRQTRPLVLILEDLQWAIESLAPLRHLRQFLPTKPWMIVASFNTDETPDLPPELADMERIHLNRFSSKEIQQLSQSILGTTAQTEAVVELLAQESEGNVYFMVEVMRALAETAGRLDDIGRVTLPTNVLTGNIDQIIQRRLNRVSPAARHLLQLTAIMGRKLDLRLIDHLAAPLHTQDWLYQCTAVSILDVQNEQWQFSHNKFRQILLDEATPEQYGQVAEAIEAVYPHDNAYAAILMEHWNNAMQPAKMLHYLGVVADQYSRISDFTTAQTLLERGFKTLKQVRVNADEIKMRLEYIAGEIDGKIGQYGQAVQHYELSLKLARQLDKQSDAANALSGLAKMAWRQGDYALATARAQESQVICQAIDNPRGLISCLSTLGTLAFFQGDYDQAETHYQAGLALSQERADKSATKSILNDLGVVMAVQGAFDEAIDYFKQSLMVCEELGDKQGKADALSNLGAFYADQQNHTQAIEYYQQGLMLYSDIGDQWGEAVGSVNLFTSYLYLDNAHEAMPHLVKGLRLAHAIDSVPTVLEALSGYATLKALENDLKTSALFKSLVEDHPALTDEVRQKWLNPLDERLNKFLSLVERETARALGEALSLDEAVRQVLEDLTHRKV